MLQVHKKKNVIHSKNWYYTENCLFNKTNKNDILPFSVFEMNNHNQTGAKR